MGDGELYLEVCRLIEAYEPRFKDRHLTEAVARSLVSMLCAYHACLFTRQESDAKEPESL